MAISLIATLRSAILTPLGTFIDGGDAAGKLLIYAGSPPANAGAGLGGATLLATLTLSDPAFASNTAGTATFDEIESATAVATGTASFFRLADSEDNVGIQGTVGTSGADLNFNTVSFVLGGTVAVTSLTISSGNA